MVEPASAFVVATALWGASVALDPDRGKTPAQKGPDHVLTPDTHGGYARGGENTVQNDRSHGIPSFGASDKTYGDGRLLYASETGGTGHYFTGINRGRSAPENAVKEDDFPLLPTEFLGITGTKDGDNIRRAHQYQANDMLEAKHDNGVAYSSGHELVTPVNPQQAHIDARTAIPLHSMKAHTSLLSGPDVSTAGGFDRQDMLKGRMGGDDFEQAVRVPERAVGVLDNRFPAAQSENEGKETTMSAVVATDDPYEYLRTSYASQDPGLISHRAPNPEGTSQLTQLDGKQLMNTNSFHSKKVIQNLRMRPGNADKTFYTGEAASDPADVIAKDRRVGAGELNRLPGRSVGGFGQSITASTHKDDMHGEKTTRDNFRAGVLNRFAQASAANFGKKSGEKHFTDSHYADYGFDPKRNASGGMGEQNMEVDTYNYLYALEQNPFHITPTLPLGRVV